MKKYITIFITANVIILVLVMGLVFLEANYPLHPGAKAYELQQAVEQAITFSPADLSSYGLRIQKKWRIGGSNP